MKQLPALIRFYFREPKVLAKYLLVGGGSAGLEFVLFNLFYGGLGMPLLAANLAAIAGIISFGFIGHKWFTFGDARPFPPQLRRYVLMIAASITLNNALVYLFIALLGWPAPLAKFLQLGICFAFNFAVSRLLVFPKPL